VPVLEALATEAESLGLEVSWQKTMMQALGNIQDVPPPSSQCWSKRLAQWRNLFMDFRSHPLANSQLSRLHETACIHAYSNAEP